MDDLRPRLEKALAGLYTFERELGGGGMSRTYVAREKALDRRVVVKVLAPELLAGISVERFRREILLAAQLQHPHVVPVLTAGDVEGLPWFTMPYVDGDSLRQRLGQGPLGISEIVGILRDVSRALAYAHAHGVIHRDIKPDNVLLSAGSATVTDFGIAKALNAARSSGDVHHRTALTVAGTSIGTPTYMAPEQAAGDPYSDHRADFYAFGVMAFEMLCGNPPFHGLPPAKLLAAQLGETPKDIRGLRLDVPESLAQLVMQCLAKEPLSRPQMASDLVRVLDTITSSGATASAPAILAGGRIRFGRALGLWGGATALVVLTAWAATDVIGLPDWVFPGSLAVMLLGLPVIITTWWVQRVVHRTYTATPHFTPGGNTAPHPQGTMATLAIKASPHLSWRRAWLGGRLAVGGFAAFVLAFMVMRAMGVGPFGSLQGRGLLGERETLVVADFVSPASDSTLGATVAEALRTDLAQSRSLQVLTRANVREILRLMRRPIDSKVEFDLAREIATREGAKAVLDGSIERLGQSYVVSARLVAALDGTELATFREEARSEDALLEALGRLTRDVRNETGESFKSIRRSTTLERVTTPSLAALRKYVEGSTIADEKGDSDRGLVLLQEAVTLDTAFAMAWRKIAVLLGNEGRERARSLDAISKAYAHRDRLSELERLSTEGYYFTRGPAPDRDRALSAYDAVIALDSTSTSALNNAAVILTERRDYVRSNALYKKVTELPRSFGGAFTNLMRGQIFVGDTVGLRETRDAFYKRYPESGDLWEGDAYLAWGRGDLDAADSIGRAVFARGKTLRQLTNSSGGVSDVAVLQGKPAESLRWATRRSEVLLRAQDTPGNRLNFAMDTAWYLAYVLERPAEARAVMERGLRRTPIAQIPPAERPWVELTQFALEARDVALARTSVEGYERDQLSTFPEPEARRAAFRGWLAFAEGKYDAAVVGFTEADNRSAVHPHFAAIYIARAHDLAGRTDSAIVYFEKFATMGDPDTFRTASYLAGTFKRLGELYEALGEREKAITNYAKFVELWKDAEPVLQPKVREVTVKLERLRASRGG